MKTFSNMNLIKKIKSVICKSSMIIVIEDFNKKSTYQKWCTYYKVASFFGRNCLQLHCLFENKSNGPIGYVPGVCCFWNGFLLIYTTYYYISNGHFFKCVPSYCVFGAIVSTYCAYWCSVLKIGLWPQLIAESESIYRDDNESSDYNRIRSECMSYSAKQYFVSLVPVLLSLFGACIGPIYTYLRDGTLVTLFELRIPCFEDNPNIEFVLNLIWQSIISLMAISALGLIEAGMALINNVITVSSKLNVLSICVLSNHLKLKDISDQQLRRKLKLIFANILNGDAYIKTFKNLLYYRLFFAPPAFTFSIAISIYSQSVLKYPAGYGLAVVSYIQMAILCLTGQNCIDRTNRLLTALSEFNWHLLPIECQRDIMCLIVFLQNNEGPRIGPFQALSFMTLKSLTRRVYTFLMFLSNFDS